MTIRQLHGDAVYRVGGAHAVAALAYGTETVPRVDKVVGPGNVWVTAAKREVSGIVGIDGLAGPTELVIVADRTADPSLLAVDLVAQNPVKMGHDGVKTIVEKLRGQSVPIREDTGVTVIDGENLKTAQVQKLLSGQA